MRDSFIGIGFVIAGVVTIITAQQFPTLPSLQYGPSLFPSLVGGGFCLGGIALTLSDLRNRQKATANAIETEALTYNLPNLKNKWAILLSPLAIVFYILASGYLGAILSMMIIMVSLMLIRKTPVHIALLVSLSMSLVIYFIFSRYLLVPLPQGMILGGSLPWIS